MLALRGAAYRYPGGASVGPLDLDVRAGEFVLLTGPTGCGKSTVLRLAAGLLQRHGHGRVAGEIRVGGVDPVTHVAAARVRALGFVGQDPDDAVVAHTCAAEVAFALESAGETPAIIEARVAEVLGRVGLEGLAERAPTALSGGQRQRLVIGAALAAGAPLLLLDEPLSQLDPEGGREILGLLRGLADEGVAILCVEHRLELAMPFADRTALMAAGKLVSADVRSCEPLRALGLRGPALDELGERTGAQRWRVGRHVSDVSIHDTFGVPPTGSLTPRPPLPWGEGEEEQSSHRGARLWLSGTFSWANATRHTLDVSLDVSPGERVALVGANGAGKSTLIGLLSGRLRSRTAQVRCDGRRVEVPQNPDLALFCDTVEEELAYGPREARLATPDVSRCITEAAQALSVDDLLARPPQALSRGQRLRTAVAAALTCRPAVLLLDEPTSGQDREQVDRMLDALPAALGDGALVFASHDLDVVLRHATRVIVLDQGRVVANGPPLPTLTAAGLPALPLPPLATLCASLGLPYLSVDALLPLLEPA